MKRFYYLAIVIVVLAGGFIPLETVNVPKWKVRVVDSDGRPMVNIEVVEFCPNYTLSLDPCVEATDRVLLSDQTGLVEFPERRVRMSLWARVFKSALNFSLQLAHGSYGTDAYLLASGPNGSATLNFVRESREPDILTLP